MKKLFSLLAVCCLSVALVGCAEKAGETPAANGNGGAAATAEPETPAAEEPAAEETPAEEPAAEEPANP